MQLSAVQMQFHCTNMFLLSFSDELLGPCQCLTFQGQGKNRVNRIVTFDWWNENTLKTETYSLWSTTSSKLIPNLKNPKITQFCLKTDWHKKEIFHFVHFKNLDLFPSVGKNRPTTKVTLTFLYEPRQNVSQSNMI